MMQTFLPAFEAVVVDSKIRGIMCAYNSVNGVPLCANELLQKQLRERMGFEGIVITDCGAIGMMTGNHHWNHSNGTVPTGSIDLGSVGTVVSGYMSASSPATITTACSSA